MCIPKAICRVLWPNKGAPRGSRSDRLGSHPLGSSRSLSPPPQGCLDQAFVPGTHPTACGRAPDGLSVKIGELSDSHSVSLQRRWTAGPARRPSVLSPSLTAGGRRGHSSPDWYWRLCVWVGTNCRKGKWGEEGSPSCCVSR